jgi:hypothetical protein
MAFHADTNWDVRATGNDANGGGFQLGATGTDRSQSDAAYQAYTDIVIDGADNTKITSAAHAFDSTSPGNIINVTAGTGFTVQRIQIVSEAAGVATCDKAVGTVGSTGGTGNLGGALATPGAAAALVVAGNKVHVKAGTYTLTATIQPNNVSPLMFIGYGATHEDNGTKPLLTSATDSVNLFTKHYDQYLIVTNFAFTHTATTRGNGLYIDNGGNAVLITDCTFDGCQSAIDSGQDQLLNMFRCSVINSVSNGIHNHGTTFLDGVKVAGSGGHGISLEGNTANTILRSRFTDNATIGINNLSGTVTVREVTCANNGSDGLYIANSWGGRYSVANSLFYGNGLWGIALKSGAPTMDASFIATANAFGGNVRGSYGIVSTSTVATPTINRGDVTLTADPFTDSASDDYSLNSAAGGGAACQAAGYQPD